MDVPQGKPPLLSGRDAHALHYLKKKHITSLTKGDGNTVHDRKQILEEEERFFKEIYQAKNVCPESFNFEHFFDNLNTLKQKEADTCEGLLTLAECTNSLRQFKNNKHLVPMALLLNFTGSSGMSLVKSWLIALTMLLKMVTCQSHKNAVLYH